MSDNVRRTSSDKIGHVSDVTTEQIAGRVHAFAGQLVAKVIDQEGNPDGVQRDRPRPRGARKLEHPALPSPEGIQPATFAALTPKQQQFVIEYLVDLNGAAAARRAGYPAQSAKQMASENLTKPDILAAIEEAFAARGGITRARIVDELGAIAFSDIGEFVDWSNEIQRVAADIKGSLGDDAIAEGDRFGEETLVITNRVTIKPSRQLDPATRRAVAKISQDRYGNLRFELHDKVGALKALGTALGMFSDTQSGSDAQQVTNNYSATIVYGNRPDSRSPPAYAPRKAVGRAGDGSD